jgi:chromosome partitioning protein
MVVTVASFKGGVGKSTTAVHLAAYLQAKAPTMLVDGDPNRSVSEWARAGNLPFKVIDERQAALHARSFEHIVIDTKARPEEEDLRALALGCHLLVIPCTPDPLSLRALRLTVTALKSIGADRYRVLLTVVPPRPSRDGDDAREMIGQMDLPLFQASIPRLVAFQRAVLEGTTVAELKDSRGQQGWEEYKRVGSETEQLVGADEDAIVSAVNLLLDSPEEYGRMSRLYNPYGDGMASHRIVNVIGKYLGV